MDSDIRNSCSQPAIPYPERKNIATRREAAIHSAQNGPTVAFCRADLNMLIKESGSHSPRPNEHRQVISTLSLLLQEDQMIETARLCDRRVWYVTELQRIRGLCGYRCMQMIISYLICNERGYFGRMQHTRADNNDRNSIKRTSLPGVLDLQTDIETAWDTGCDAFRGKEELGNLWGTRKCVGTPEVSVSRTSPYH